MQVGFHFIYEKEKKKKEEVGFYYTNPFFHFTLSKAISTGDYITLIIYCQYSVFSPNLTIAKNSLKSRRNCSLRSSSIISKVHSFVRSFFFFFFVVFVVDQPPCTQVPRDPATSLHLSPLIILILICLILQPLNVFLFFLLLLLFIH